MARVPNNFAKEHMEECQQLYLMSRRVTALDERAEIPFMEGYFYQQVEPDYLHDVKEWWEVIDRTTGEVVSPQLWTVDPKRNILVIEIGRASCRERVSA